MKKIIAIFTLVLMMSLVLVGCSIPEAEGNKENEIIEDQKEDKNPEQTPPASDSEEDEQNKNPDPIHPDDETKPDDPTNPGDEIKPDDQQPTDPIVPDEPEYGTEVGNRFADIVIEGLYGDEINTADYRGKFIILNVWGTWCGPCKAELPAFNLFASDYKDEVVIIAAHSNYKRGDAKGYVESNFASSLILFGYDNASEDVFSAAGGELYYPRTMIISPEGIIVYVRDGSMQYSELEIIINQNK